MVDLIKGQIKIVNLIKPYPFNKVILMDICPLWPNFWLDTWSKRLGWCNDERWVRAFEEANWKGGFLTSKLSIGPLKSIKKSIATRGNNWNSWSIDQHLSITKECKPTCSSRWYWAWGADGKILFYYLFTCWLLGLLVTSKLKHFQILILYRRLNWENLWL